jgi:hypothetical protein
MPVSFGKILANHTCAQAQTHYKVDISISMTETSILILPTGKAVLGLLQTFPVIFHFILKALKFTGISQFMH